MPTIPYPAVPNYPGVPAIPRTGLGSPAINISIAANQDFAINQTPGDLPWGIFTQANQPIYTPTEGGTLSVLTFGFTRSMNVSKFPVEANNSGQGAAFASFNKVFQPSNPIVTLAMSGTEGEKIAFLKAIDDACQSTNIYNVYTPDASYSGSTGGCTIDRYSYQRSATRGATMLIVEVSLTQVLQVTTALSNVSLPAPQSPSASGPVSNGNTQPSAPPPSWLAQILTSNSNLLGVP
jgi:hypothetical protein